MLDSDRPCRMGCRDMVAADFAYFAWSHFARLSEENQKLKNEIELLKAKLAKPVK